MTNHLHNLKKEAELLRMSAAEKQAMRTRLGEILGTVSPVTVRTSPYQVFFSFHMMTRVVAGFLVVALLGGGGVVSAAQGALPGDLLYPIKTAVTEPIEGALAQGPTAKAAWHAELASRRVEEAQSLASAGRLDEDVSIALEENINLHVEGAEALATALEEEDPAAAAEVRATLTSSLATHASVLAQLGDESESAEIRERSNILATRVLARIAWRDNAFATETATLARSAKSETESQADATATMSLTVESAPAAATVENAQDASLQHTAGILQERAALTLADARKKFQKFKSSLDAKTAARVEEQFGFSDEAMSQGSLMLGSGAYHEAIADFTEVLGASLKLSTLFDAQKKFGNNEILKTLLPVEVEVGSEDSPDDESNTEKEDNSSSSPETEMDGKEEVEQESETEPEDDGNIINIEIETPIIPIRIGL